MILTGTLPNKSGGHCGGYGWVDGLHTIQMERSTARCRGRCRNYRTAISIQSYGIHNPDVYTQGVIRIRMSGIIYLNIRICMNRGVHGTMCATQKRIHMSCRICKCVLHIGMCKTYMCVHARIACVMHNLISLNYVRNDCCDIEGTHEYYLAHEVVWLAGGFFRSTVGENR